MSEKRDAKTAITMAEPGDRRALLCSKIMTWCEQAPEARSSQASPD